MRTVLLFHILSAMMTANANAETVQTAHSVGFVLPELEVVDSVDAEGRGPRVMILFGPIAGAMTGRAEGLGLRTL
jgi:hypothetical protein